MSNNPLCVACQTFLRGESLYDGEEATFTHHPSAQSFQGALDLPCAICIRLWTAINHDYEFNFTDDRVPEILPTTYKAPRIRRQDLNSKSRLVSFQCGRYGTTLVFEAWEGQFETRSLAAQLIETTENLDRYSTLLPCSTGSDTALDFFTSQYTRCREEHVKCQLSAPPNDFLPTRVIDVGIDGNSTVHLREGDDLTTGAPYVALSHCWGKSPLFILTQATATELKEGVAVTCLPKTFQDAIVATRKLRFRYIWIDSLCIFQDNLEDWHVEAGHMRNIYSKATCCIAATAAKDGITGLFFDRDPRGLTPIKVEATWTHKQALPRFPPPGKYWCGCHWITAYSAVDEAPLNQRAWVAQERYLSPRILHFSWDVLFWECHEIISNEVYPDGIPKLGYSGGGNYDTRKIKTLVGDIRRGRLSTNVATQNDNALAEVISNSEATREDIYQSWCTFRSAYTAYGMTKEKDILVALSGIVQDVAEAMNDECIAGLWKNRLLEDLCWHCSPGYVMRHPGTTNRPSKWRAPSWSWASTTLPVSASHLISSSKNYTHSRSMAVIKGVSVSAKPSGELESASIAMECRLISVELHVHDNLWVGNVELLNEARDSPLHQVLLVQFDSPSLGYTLGNNYNVKLLLLRHFYDRDDVEACVEGLVIAPSQHTLGSYERVGTYTQSYNDEVDRETNVVLRLLSKYNETESQTIELV